MGTNGEWTDGKRQLILSYLSLDKKIKHGDIVRRALEDYGVKLTSSHVSSVRKQFLDSLNKKPDPKAPMSDPRYAAFANLIAASDAVGGVDTAIGILQLVKRF